MADWMDYFSTVPDVTAPAVPVTQSWDSFFQGLSSTIVSGYMAKDAAQSQNDFVLQSQRQQFQNPALTGNRLTTGTAGGGNMLLIVALGLAAVFLVMKS